MMEFYETKIGDGTLLPTSKLSALKHVKTLAIAASRIISNWEGDDPPPEVQIGEFISYVMQDADEGVVQGRLRELFRNGRANEQIPSLRDPLNVSGRGATPLVAVSQTNELAYESALTLLNFLSSERRPAGRHVWPQIPARKVPPFPPVKDDAERRCITLNHQQSTCENAIGYCKYDTADGSCCPAGT